MKLTKQQIGVALATILTIGISIAINVLPLNNITTIEILNRFDFKFIPANYIFIFWGLVYLFLLIFSFGQQMVAQKEREYTKDIFSWYILASIINSLWLVAWHFDFFLTSIILMLTLLISLIAIYAILRNNSPKSIMERIIIHIPFQIYLGWIVFIFITNVSIIINSNWNNFGLTETTFTSVLLLLIGTIGVLSVLYLSDLVIVSVLIWSIIGVVVKNWGQTDILVVSIITLVLLIGIAGLKRFYKPKVKKTKGTQKSKKIPTKRKKFFKKNKKISKKKPKTAKKLKLKKLFTKKKKAPQETKKD